jgi:hypothetical protein
MNENTPKPGASDPRRRLFLRAAGGAGALATMATVAGESAAVAPAPQPAVLAAAAAPVGYHETEHIRQYYRTAKYW